VDAQSQHRCTGHSFKRINALGFIALDRRSREIRIGIVIGRSKQVARSSNSDDTVARLETAVIEKSNR